MALFPVKIFCRLCLKAEIFQPDLTNPRSLHCRNTAPALSTGQVPGVAPPTPPYFFSLPERSRQEKAPQSPGPLRGFPAPGRHLAGGQKLAMLRHLSTFIAKRPPCSGGGERGNTKSKIPESIGRGAPMCAPVLFKLPSLLKEGMGVVGSYPSTLRQGKRVEVFHAPGLRRLK